MGTILRTSFLIITFIVSACSTNQTSVAQISAQLEKQGPDIFLNTTVKDQKAWFSHIATLQQGMNDGNVQALTIVSKLKAISDAGVSETLNFMVARAIPYNANIVTASIANGFELREICNIPFIEEEKAVVDDYLEKSTLSLKEAMAYGDTVAGECLSILESLNPSKQLY